MGGRGKVKMKMQQVSLEGKGMHISEKVGCLLPRHGLLIYLDKSLSMNT